MSRIALKCSCRQKYRGSVTRSPFIPQSVIRQPASARLCWPPFPIKGKPVNWSQFTTDTLRGCTSRHPTYAPFADRFWLIHTIRFRYTPIPEAEFEDTIFSRIYDQRMEMEPAPKDSHRLAVFCLVLALGALLDLDRPSLSTDATRYYQLGRAVLSLDSILESQSIPAIQALVRFHTVPASIAGRPLSGFAPMSTDPCSSHVSRSSCATTCSSPSWRALGGPSWASL